MIPARSESPAVKPSDPNLGALASVRPAEGTRGWVKNLLLAELGDKRFPDTIGFLFRPTPVNVNFSVNDEEMNVIGMSHKYASYVNTNNVVVQFELYMNTFMIIKENMIDGNRREGGKGDISAAAGEIERVRIFLQSLCYPGLIDNGMIGGEQPPVILCMPGICTIRAKLKQLGEIHQRNDIDGFPIEMRVQCVFHEAPMGRITMQDVLSNGLRRTWGR